MKYQRTEAMKNLGTDMKLLWIILRIFLFAFEVNGKPFLHIDDISCYEDIEEIESSEMFKKKMTHI